MKGNTSPPTARRIAQLLLSTSGLRDIIRNCGHYGIAVLPGVPTLGESGIKDADALSWYGLSAPIGKSLANIAKLNLELNRILSLADVRRRFDELGFEVTVGSPKDFDRFLNREIQDLSKLIAIGGLRPEILIETLPDF
jgi:tripartite-type tricarboxylate transporter receptor subunit TctC